MTPEGRPTINISKRTKGGLLGAAILVSTLTVNGYASTNSITSEEASSTAGLGAGLVAKVEINDVDYTLDASDKTHVVSVVFSIDTPIVSGASGAGDTVAFAQHNGGTVWTSCGAVANGATSISCPISDDIENFGKDSNGDPAPLRLVISE